MTNNDPAPTSYPPLGVAPFGEWTGPVLDIGDNGYLVEIAAKAQILRYLETECERQQVFWTERLGVLRAAMVSQAIPTFDLGPIEIMRVPPQNVFIGARPSLVQAPISFWPSVTVRTGDLVPARGADMDHYDVFDCELYVEVMTYAGPVGRDYLHLQEGIDAEGAANVQAHLLSCAVQMCISRDPTLGGSVPHIQAPPRIHPSFPTAQTGTDVERTGDNYYIYQGRQLTYTITRNSY
jgi:hypothetical protein